LPAFQPRVFGILVEVSSSPLSFRLDQYEGPLDLLLDLIRKQQINIYDIPIAQITDQYLNFMREAAALDMELGAEFVYMAATLIHIKSRTLLPRDPELEKFAPEQDPRQELVERLLEHERFKNAAEMLHQKRMIEEAIWSNPRIHEFAQDDQDPGLAVSLFDLVKTLQTVLERAKSRPTYEVGREEVSVPDMIRMLKDSFRPMAARHKLSAAQLFEKARSRRGMICLFLAILELVKVQAIGLVQSDLFGDIWLEKQDNFDEAISAEPAVTSARED
jgi:segregation and condensation protein A